MRIRVRQHSAYHQGIFPAFGKLRAACQHHAELLGGCYRRNHVTVCISDRDRIACIAAHVRGAEKRLSAARETLRHARRADHEHRTARNDRLAIVVKRAIAIARRAVDEYRAARDFHAAVAVDGIARRVEHKRSAVDLNEAVGRTCTRGTTLIATTLATTREATAIRRTSTRCGHAFAWRFSIDSNTALARSATIISILIIVRAIRQIGSA